MVSNEIDDKHFQGFSENLDLLDTLKIPVLNNDVSYHYFYKHHLQKNLPCIIKNVSENWKCTESWISDGKINYEFFRTEYGNLEAPVADCHEITFNSHCKKDMKVSEYMQYLMNNSDKSLYLKDWHLRRMRPDDKFYEVPSIFSSDWLNEYALDHNEDDFMFVYIGPKGSWTPLHVDVYSSYSWSVNVTGLKKWILFPPDEENKLKDAYGNLPLHFVSANHENIKYFEILQEKGDAIFVPSKWHHEVSNLLDTISVNHNWINACNINIVWEELEQNLKLVEQEIDEFKSTPEYVSECQLMLKSLFGMNYQCFINFLLYIAEKRLKQLKGIFDGNFEKHVPENSNVRFDLKTILKLVNLILKQRMFFDKCSVPDIECTLTKLKSCLVSELETIGT